MAKVIMPLMSGSASGSFAKAMVFSTNKGRNIVRQLVTPSNPNTSAQRVVRNKLALAAGIMAVINRTNQLRAGATQRDEIELRAYAPSGITWNASVSSEVIGAFGAKFAAAGAAYALANAATWTTAALALAVPYAPLIVPNPAATGTITISAGEQFFRHQYALFTAGVLLVAPTTPPTYA